MIENRSRSDGPQQATETHRGMSKSERSANNITRTRKKRGRPPWRFRHETANSERATSKQHRGFRGVHRPFTLASESISALLKRRRRRAYARCHAGPSATARQGDSLIPGVVARGLKDCRTYDDMRRRLEHQALRVRRFSTGVENMGDNRGVVAFAPRPVAGGGMTGVGIADGRGRRGGCSTT